MNLNFPRRWPRHPPGSSRRVRHHGRSGHLDAGRKTAGRRMSVVVRAARAGATGRSLQESLSCAAGRARQRARWRGEGRQGPSPNGRYQQFDERRPDPRPSRGRPRVTDAVVDSSVVVAALLDRGPVGSWPEALLASGRHAAPHLMPSRSPTSCDAQRWRARLLPMLRRWRTRIFGRCGSSSSPTACVQPGCGSCDRPSPPTSRGTSRWPKPWERDWPLSTPD